MMLPVHPTRSPFDSCCFIVVEGFSKIKTWSRKGTIYLKREIWASADAKPKLVSFQPDRKEEEMMSERPRDDLRSEAWNAELKLLLAAALFIFSFSNKCLELGDKDSLLPVVRTGCTHHFKIYVSSRCPAVLYLGTKIKTYFRSCIFCHSNER